MFVRHVTLQTGHMRDSHREEVRPDVLAVCRVLLARSRLDEDASEPIPGMGAYRMESHIQGRCMVALVWGGSDMLAVIGVAAHARCGARLWRILHGATDLPPGSLLLPPEQRAQGEYRITDPRHQPRVPWCAAALASAIGRHTDAMTWLGDFERCLAWAFLECGHDD